MYVCMTLQSKDWDLWRWRRGREAFFENLLGAEEGVKGVWGVSALMGLVMMMM